jgi:hypothetical protein
MHECQYVRQEEVEHDERPAPVQSQLCDVVAAAVLTISTISTINCNDKSISRKCRNTTFCFAIAY